jgi:hypothetical protein
VTSDLATLLEVEHWTAKVGGGRAHAVHLCECQRSGGARRTAGGWYIATQTRSQRRMRRVRFGSNHRPSTSRRSRRVSPVASPEAREPPLDRGARARGERAELEA